MARVIKQSPMATQVLQPLLELTERVGRNPLLTQASTGNSSAKLDGVLWVKASGKWMADARRDDILIPLDLQEIVNQSLHHNVDPAERYPGASLETAMHAVLPHRVVLHVHCVDAIAWAVRRDAPQLLQSRLEGLRWRWIPYVASGLPLAREIVHTLAAHPETDLLVLGNHGLVIGGEDAAAVWERLLEVEKRLAIVPRPVPPPDRAALLALCQHGRWGLPEDEEMHALATDPVCEKVLSGGLLYPCQAIFSDSAEFFLPIPYAEVRERQPERPFLILEGRGVLVSGSMTPAELAMLSGLAQVARRLSDTTPLRYLGPAEVSAISGRTAYRYRELANANHDLKRLS